MAPDAVAAAAAAMANAAGGLFLPLVHPMATLPLSMQKQLGLQFGMQAPPPLLRHQAGSGAGVPALPSIRTRAAAASPAIPLAGPAAAGTPGSGGNPLPDLQDFLLSPLAASLLSPLGRNGTPLGEPSSAVALAPLLCTAGLFCFGAPTQQPSKPR
jgi:hypothetical protein